MSNNKTEVSKDGIGLLGCLFLLFVYLKLTGHIAWSWWWVTCPLWGGFALIFGFVFGGAALMGVFYGVGALIEKVGDWRRDRQREKLAKLARKADRC